MICAKFELSWKWNFDWNWSSCFGEEDEIMTSENKQFMIDTYIMRIR